MMNILRTTLFRRFYRPFLQHTPALRAGAIGTAHHRDFLRQEIRQSHLDVRNSSPPALQFEAQLIRRRSWPMQSEEQRIHLRQGVRQAHADARSITSPGRSGEDGRPNLEIPVGKNPTHYLPQ
eukprot:CAMPEP_0119015024 /NCGR_PEP_ID=MMETSP1176-20130426/10516_1 /TAXON_ID=265551 /ORGANISM="Synedropsis recta cf, Strain CCMP1620" /LENGTH=122 /DNA_ID=CAMNT_0006968283 /DNA_START=46 /DNA_END=414 /DNA_ORIENTATION=-